MTLDDLAAHAGAWWLILAAALAVAELLVPGAFLAFLAVGAAVTGALAFVLPGLSLPLQLLSFAAWSGVAVAIGRQWYGNTPGPAADPLLNDRAARLVGEVVTVVQPIAGGRGRVAVGDGAWPAKGPDLPAGARARVIGHEGGVLVVEGIAALST